MAATTAAIREALRAALAGNATIAAGWQISGYMLALPQPPAIDIRPGSATFDSAMSRGNDELEFIIRAMVAFNSDQGAQVKLDTLLDTTTSSAIKTVIESDRTLGGVVSYVQVRERAPYQGLTVEGQPPILGVEFTVLVLP